MDTLTNTSPTTLSAPSTQKVEGQPTSHAVLILTEAIEAFRAAKPQFFVAYSKSASTLPLSAFTDPVCAWGACDEVSEAFAHFLQEKGLNAQYIRSGSFVNNNLIQSGVIPYQEHLFEEEHHAYVAVVEEGVQKYVVDWTAAQFGYTQFPLVWQQQNGAYVII